MKPSIFADEQPIEQLQSGLSTRAQAAEIEAAVNKLGLGGGAAVLDVDLTMVDTRGDVLRPWVVKTANGNVINVGLLRGVLAKATAMQIVDLKAQYAKPGLNGPIGINWPCTEVEYVAIREAAKDAGLVVQGGGTISEGVVDIEAIGRTSFGLPAQGHAPQNFVIQFEPKGDSEAPIVNACFLGEMLKAGGAYAAAQFVLARTMPKGWRAS